MKTQFRTQIWLPPIDFQLIEMLEIWDCSSGVILTENIDMHKQLLGTHSVGMGAADEQQNNNDLRLLNICHLILTCRKGSLVEVRKSALTF